MARSNLFASIFIGTAMFALGVVLGVAVGPRLHVHFVSDSFLEERMAECAVTAAIAEAARGNDRVLRVIEGDIRQCALLVEMHGERRVGSGLTAGVPAGAP
jgi:hypothetical protein